MFEDIVTTRGASASARRAEQETGERERAEVVGAELQLEAVRRLPPGRRHHARVVEQQVHTVRGGVRERADRVQAGHVHEAQLEVGVRRIGAHTCEGRLTALCVAAGKDGVGSGAAERERSVVADPAVGAGDDRGPSLLAGDIRGGPVAHSALYPQ